MFTYFFQHFRLYFQYYVNRQVNCHMDFDICFVCNQGLFPIRKQTSYERKSFLIQIKNCKT